MRLILLISTFLLTVGVSAQEYITAHEDESVKVEYSILEVKKKKEFVGELRLVITNKTDDYINMGFVAALFYNITLAEETQVENLCIAPGKVKKGKIKGLFYQPETLSYDQLTSDEFEVSIDDLEVIKVENCK